LPVGIPQGTGGNAEEQGLLAQGLPLVLQIEYLELQHYTILSQEAQHG